MADRVEDKTIRSINMVQIGRALTDPKLDPPIRALVVYNSNPAVIAPSQNLVFEGLRREDLLTVVVEQFLTDTARFADYVFPATSQLEHLDLLTSWGQEYLSLNQPAVPPQGEAVPNSEFFRRLSRRMGFSEPYLYESDEELVKTLLRSKHPYLGGVTYEQLRERGWVRLALPEPWLPFAKGGFPTPSGKCEFFSKSLEARGVDPLPTYVPLPDDARKQPRARTFPLALLTTKSTLHFNNSSHGGEPRQRKAEGEPRLQIHAEDAAPAEHPGRRHGARLQRPGLGADDGEGRGRDAAGRRLAAPRLLAEPPPGRLLRERPHPGRPERPRGRRRLPRRARRGGARVRRLYSRPLHASPGRVAARALRAAAPIGAGGMGEVWRGKDTRLDRSVAVKILPAAFAEDEERRQRFEREAKAISSLNHPHICTLFDVGHEGDAHFLVMELLEGEVLADRLQKGPLPLDQVVKLGAQVAEALSAAHKQGIVHRDLKPGNVVLTKTGAKLLDFGLARTGAGTPALSRTRPRCRPR